jgi:hypothetical protein
VKIAFLDDNGTCGGSCRNRFIIFALPIPGTHRREARGAIRVLALPESPERKERKAPWFQTLRRTVSPGQF